MRTRAPSKTMVASLALAACSCFGWAADEVAVLANLKSMSLEDLAALRVDTVVGASGHGQKLTEAPSAVSMVTADDIRKQGYRTLADGFVVANATLFNSELGKGLEVSASVYSLLDQSYHDPVSTECTRDFNLQDGRASRGKLTYRF